MGKLGPRLCLTALIACILLLVLTVVFSQGPRRPETDRARETPGTIYVVQELKFRYTGNRSQSVLDDERPGRPVKAFFHRDRAQAFCLELNRKQRGNPFRYLPEGFEGGGGSFLDYYATRGEANFLDLLKSEGLVPPTLPPEPEFDESAPAWESWWEEHFAEWDRALVERLWAALDRLQFYEVIEVSVEP